LRQDDSYGVLPNGRSREETPAQSETTILLLIVLAIVESSLCAGLRVGTGNPYRRLTICVRSPRKTTIAVAVAEAQKPVGLLMTAELRCRYWTDGLIIGSRTFVLETGAAALNPARPLPPPSRRKTPRDPALPRNTGGVAHLAQWRHDLPVPEVLRPRAKNLVAATRAWATEDSGGWKQGRPVLHDSLAIEVIFRPAE